MSHNSTSNKVLTNANTPGGWKGELQRPIDAFGETRVNGNPKLNLRIQAQWFRSLCMDARYFIEVTHLAQ